MNKQNEIAEILRPGRESLSTLLALWDEMGLDTSQREKRLLRVQETVSNLLHDLLAEERETKRAIVEQIEHLRRRIDDLCRELEVSPATPPDESLPMVKLEKELHMCLSGLKERRQQRMAQVEALRRRDSVVALRLGEKPFQLGVPDGALPSSSQVAALENRVHELTGEMDKRMNEVRRLRGSLEECLHELDLKAPTDYDKWSLTVEPALTEVFPLTLAALVELESVVRKYQHLRDTAAERYRELMGRIELLWKRLVSNPDEIHAFLESLPNSKPASLRVLDAELRRLEVLKQENMAHFLSVCKDELKLLREQCFIGMDEIVEWDAAAAQETSPDLLLERYEAEIARLKANYEQHEAVFAKVINWNASFEKLRITELRMKDPSVLSNRGGVLLKYEKTKRAALKTLRTLEMGLRDVGDTHIEGLPVLTYIERRRQTYEEEKENEKKQRQEKATVMLKNESRFGCKPILTPTRKRTLGTTNTPTSGLTFIGSHEQSKLRKIANNACHQFRLKRVSLAKRRQSRCGTGHPKMSQWRLDRAVPSVAVVHSPAPTREVPVREVRGRESGDTTYTQFAQSINARSSLLRQDSGLSSYRSGPTTRQ